ncbi:hypothetical protein D8674_008848 [Pyrus ussuriensis x Pyrus communis]|uniref:Uncharacterized protein n=1 Tax=Pyrus ussuriensis x Pyrus communis TaxID=2448454 RepID=A0A5N5HUJ5_9ROSA|nr:hypothetical protein D8674_008848 [Pyrus ussuriensis x Pyrus communis]
MMIQINKPPVLLPPPPPQGCLTTAAVPTRAGRNLLVLNAPTRSTTIPTTISMARQVRHSVLPIIPMMKRGGRRAMAASDSVSPAAVVDVDMQIRGKKNNKNNKVFKAYGDPCLDLFFNVTQRPSDYREKQQETEKKYHTRMFNYLRQQLPLAWSHDPLTTLKLIFNLSHCNIDGSKWYSEAFEFAAVWLHHNHPDTLLRNFGSLADSFGPSFTLLDVLYGLLVPPQDQLDHTLEELLQRENPNSHADRYARDPAYRLLHDRGMDAFAERLKSDLEKLKQNKLELKPCDYDDDVDDDTDYNAKRGSLDAHAYNDLQVSWAIYCLLTGNPWDAHKGRSISLEESTARRLLPPESDVSREWERLRKEVLAPLKNYSRRQSRFDRWERCEVKKYLEEVKAATTIIKPDALLPNDILRYLEDGNVGEAAELQWKAMVQKVKEGGKFKNCWAVCDNGLCQSRSLSLGLLVYELSEEPWNRKVMNFSLPDSRCKFIRPIHFLPQLHSIQGLDDVKSKFSFLTRMDRRMDISICIDLQMVFDAILEVAVKENLKPEQMIKKLFLFTDCAGYDWKGYETLYEAIRSMFEDKGYGDDAVPHIVFWDFWGGYHSPSFDFPHRGVTVLRGYSKNLIKSFLDNGGDFRPHHLMEVAIADKEYQTLAVVD